MTSGAVAHLGGSRGWLSQMFVINGLSVVVVVVVVVVFFKMRDSK